MNAKKCLYVDNFQKKLQAYFIILCVHDNCMYISLVIYYIFLLNKSKDLSSQNTKINPNHPKKSLFELNYFTLVPAGTVRRGQRSSSRDQRGKSTFDSRKTESRQRIRTTKVASTGVAGSIGCFEKPNDARTKNAGKRGTEN